MKEPDVKLIIDYTNGYCKIIDSTSEKTDEFQRPIIGYNKEKFAKIIYNRTLVRRSRYKMMQDIDKLYDANPNCECSVSLIKNVDPLIYRTLKDLDNLKGTSYALEYLKAMTRMFDEKRYAYLTRKEFREMCKETRRQDLEKCGIQISYNVGLFNASKRLRFSDRIKGLLWARKQRRLANVDVKSLTSPDENIKHKSNEKQATVKNESENDKANSEVQREMTEQEKIEKVYQAIKMAQERDRNIGAKSKSSSKKNSREIRHWTRKVRNEKDSIKNKKFKSFNDKTKRRLIAGALTVLILASIPAINNLKKHSSDEAGIEITETETVGTEITNEERIEEFRRDALKMYQDSIIIGEKPKIGDILMNQTYSYYPDGTGRVGYFSDHKDYSIGYINIITENGWETVYTNGKSLSDLLSEYPNYITYNIAFEDNTTGGGLGFVTQEQYERMVGNRIDQIIDNRINRNLNLKSDSDLFIDLDDTSR